MAWWDKQLLRKLQEDQKQVVLYKRYIDDINLAIKTATKNENNQGNIPETDTTIMNKILFLANSIHPSIQLELDSPYKHTDEKMPLLDIKLWTEKVENNGREYTIIMHEFYKKTVATKSVIHANSAISWSSKRTILSQEGLRILLRCSRNLPWEIKAEHMSGKQHHVPSFSNTIKFCEHLRAYATNIKKSSEKQSSNTLVITTYGYTHVGLYTCEAFNGDVKAQSKSASVELTLAGLFCLKNV